ncbi:MAG: ABC transporter substrate-binding protein, partial [Anaerococcus sp.]|nr:ABC transporter substrate-binding protein [Anaerococcus sp.]MDD7045391.1 ABC transporter substrate-binding protein [Peptoniphilaceae bacterium]MDY2918198.1 ABC transporter substrate-binding protein [Anaerococcus sp.]
MKNKKIFSSLFTLGLATTLVACGNSGDSTTEIDENAPSEPSQEEKQEEASVDTATTEEAGAEAANFESQTADDTLVIGNSEMSGDFYTGWSSNAYDVKVRRLIGTEGNNSYQTVVQDESGAWVNNSAVLAEDPVREENEDGSKTITFKIKEDLKWSDGEAVTSDDY